MDSADEGGGENDKELCAEEFICLKCEYGIICLDCLHVRLENGRMWNIIIWQFLQSINEKLMAIFSNKPSNNLIASLIFNSKLILREICV